MALPDALLGIVDTTAAAEVGAGAPLSVPPHIPRWMAPMLEEPLSGSAFLATIRHAQAALLDMRYVGERAGDVLTAGCRRDDAGSSLRDERLSSVYPNTTLAALTTSKEWYGVFVRLGPQRFYRMLLTTACFVAVGSGSYMQLWGAPITEAERSVSRSSTRTHFSRARVFYARPWRAYRRGIMLGLASSRAWVLTGRVQRATHERRRGCAVPSDMAHGRDAASAPEHGALIASRDAAAAPAPRLRAPPISVLSGPTTLCRGGGECDAEWPRRMVR